MPSNGSESLCSENEQTTDNKTCQLHEFSNEEIKSLRSCLLDWYASNKRDLPWRRLIVDEQDRNQRGYVVWVSEVMLQQTQVATVVDYYNKWMKQWPTLQHSARATLEQVNEMWSGLGYYSRARRLHEGCKKVVNEMSGEMPKNAGDLVKHLPGVGRYTAGAIASIAFGEVTGVVDGNVVRVLSRLRVIGKDSSTSVAVDAFWRLVTELIDPTQPGDFNQAMMELGATVCTPKSPQCQNCPLSDLCLAYKHTAKVISKEQSALKSFLNGAKEHVSCQDIEDLFSENCQLCFPKDGTWITENAVCNYPRKQKPKEAKQERVAVCILEYCNNTKSAEDNLILICKRPPAGLLAGLWEFPNIVVEESTDVNKDLIKFLMNEFEIVLNKEKLMFLGEIRHIFSHIHHTYVVQKVVIAKQPESLTNAPCTSGRNAKWVTVSEFMSAAVSTAMKKVFKLYKNGATLSKKGMKRKNESKETSRKQRVLDSYFARK